jgi:F0F1-type ATP synthase alpha subunit
LEVGLVLDTVDGVSRVVGLDEIFVGELLVLSIVRALAMNLELLMTGLTVLGSDRQVEQADIVERSFAELLIEIGFYLLGRVLDPVANFLDE